MGTFDLDGIFEKAFDKLVDDLLSGAIGDYNINKNRPSVTTLEFRPVPAKKAEEIRNVKTGLLGGGTKKQLAASIDGRKFALLVTELRTFCVMRRNTEGTDSLTVNER